jgi:soluble lytic murein transglycosylase-like protein
MQNPKARVFTLVFLLPLLFIIPILFSAPRPQASLVVNRAAPDSLPSLSAKLYAGAARALRQENLQEARQILEEIATEHPKEAANARLLAGLYTQAAGKSREAVEILAATATPDGPLEDWRLYLLAQDALKQDDATGREAARGYYTQLFNDHPTSPLRGTAYLEAAEIAADEGEDRAALNLLEQARLAGIQGETAADIEALAWKLSRRLKDEPAQIEAGRRLLVADPLSSAALEASRTLRSLGDRLDAPSLLSAGELLGRAQAFLDSDHASAALTTLDSVDAAEQGFEWQMLKAEALTRSRRGLEALSLLDLALPATTGERAQLEWQRAQAAAGAAGRSSFSASERRRMLDLSNRYLTNAGQLDAGLAMPTDALQDLYEQYRSAGLSEPALGTLRLLRRVDPQDGTGATELWEEGWEHYRDGQLAAAVRSWENLAEIYPNHREAHRGSYWMARALEGLGRPEPAREIYRDLVAESDTADFYGGRSLDRLADLGEGPTVRTAALTTRPAGTWPEPALRRAKMMIDLGLDDLAEREMELLEGQASARDLLALEALLMCRQGEQRTGLLLLREAFPDLGGPYQSTVPVEVLHAYYPFDYRETIEEQAEKTGLPASLIAGIIRQESAFDPRATSPVGARGLMQLMPGTAREMSGKVGLSYVPERLYDPEVSVRLGSAYFKEVLDGFDGNVELALAGYNGGPNRIRRLWNESGGDAGANLDSFLENLYLDESRNYVKRILVLSDSYRQLYPSAG